MDQRAPAVSQGKRRGIARRWHRWLGFLVVFPMLFVSLTGVLLNHADDLSLNDRRVSSPWLLNRYGMGLSGDPVSFVVGSNTLTGWMGNLFLNGSALGLSGEIAGVVTADEAIAVVCADVIYLLNQDGGLIEALEPHALPEGRMIGAAEGGVVRLENDSLWQFTPDYLEFNAIDDAVKSMNWSAATETPAQLRGQIEHSYRGAGLPWSRFLLDLHSGRFFGSIGRWVADGCVVLLIVLSITGLRLGLRNRRGERNGKNSSIQS